MHPAGTLSYIFCIIGFLFNTYINIYRNQSNLKTLKSTIEENTKDVAFPFVIKIAMKDSMEISKLKEDGYGIYDHPLVEYFMGRSGNNFIGWGREQTNISGKDKSLK